MLKLESQVDSAALSQNRERAGAVWPDSVLLFRPVAFGLSRLSDQPSPLCLRGASQDGPGSIIKKTQIKALSVG